MTPPGVEGSAAFTVIWWAVATMTVIAAVLVVHLQDLVKAAVALIASFLGVAALFVLLSAEFLAVVQLLIYVGAVSILLIFGILMMRDVQRGSPFNRLRLPAIPLMAVVLGVLAFVIVDTPWNLLRDVPSSPELQAAADATYGNSSPVLGGLLLREFVLPLETAALVLMAALLGAIALVRDHGAKS